MVLKLFFDISISFRFSKISVECTLHSEAPPCSSLQLNSLNFSQVFVQLTPAFIFSIMCCAFHIEANAVQKRHLHEKKCQRMPRWHLNFYIVPTWVVYIWFSLLQLTAELCDLSQAEKNILLIKFSFSEKTTIFRSYLSIVLTNQLIY